MLYLSNVLSTQQNPEGNMKPLTIEIKCSDFEPVRKLLDIFLKYQHDLPKPMLDEIEQLSIEMGV